MTTVENLYLTGNYAPVPDELTAAHLPVTGRLPEELQGRYLRNGPNPVRAPEPSTYHWFTGDGMVHGIRLRDGKAEWYRNRWVRSSDVASGFPNRESRRDIRGYCTPDFGSSRKARSSGVIVRP